MPARYQIFWTNHSKIKKAREKIEKLPDRNRIKKLLYNSFKGIDDGNYEGVHSCLKEETRKPSLREYKDMIYGVLDAYLKAYRAIIPLDVTENYEDLRGVEIDRKTLAELVESFNK